MTRSIVVIHPGALGDLLLAVPSFERLRKHHSEHKIVLVSQEPIGRFLAVCRIIDDWISIHRADVAGLFTGYAADGSQITNWLGHCDVCVVWMKDEDHRIEKTLRSFGVRKLIVRSPFDMCVQSIHQSDRFLETLGEPEATCFEGTRVALPPDIVQKGREYLCRQGIMPEHPFVVIHPGSGSRWKCVNPEILSAAIMRLQDTDRECLILEGPADQGAVERLCTFVQTPIRIIQGQELSTVAGILSHAALYIGHDSGITHLSGCIGVPTIALFGPTDPERWAPRGPKVRVFRGMPCACLSWEEVQCCTAKPCLAIQSDRLFDVCGTIEELSGLRL